jgi:proteic killer suppression protein
LKKQYEDARSAKKAYGEEVARRYILRLNTIKQAFGIDELQGLPGLNCHELKGNRKGEWAITMIDFYRLIFTLTGERLENVCIEEVSKHYDD